MQAKCIFRICGSAAEMEAQKNKIEQGTYPVPTDVHTCGSLLKTWLRALPQPLILNTK